MTNKEAIEYLENFKNTYWDGMPEEVIDVAIEALKPKTCHGCVRENSRELEELCNYCCRWGSDRYESLEDVLREEEELRNLREDY